MLRRSVLGGLVGGVAVAGGLAREAFAARPGRRQAVDRLRCVKHERRLYAYAGDDLVMSFNVALGREPRGHKVQEGDGRTPEGLYHIVAARPDSDFYRSLKISYPNAEDRERARALGVRPGGQIMIHGLDPAMGSEWRSRHWIFNWTNGCIAVTDTEMDALWNSVPLGTPIEIIA